MHSPAATADKDNVELSRPNIYNSSLLAQSIGGLPEANRKYWSWSIRHHPPPASLNDLYTIGESIDDGRKVPEQSLLLLNPWRTPPCKAACLRPTVIQQNGSKSVGAARVMHDNKA